MNPETRKLILQKELQALIGALRERGFEMSDELSIAELDETTLHALRWQFRDTLRTLGGADR